MKKLLIVLFIFFYNFSFGQLSQKISADLYQNHQLMIELIEKSSYKNLLDNKVTFLIPNNDSFTNFSEDVMIKLFKSNNLIEIDKFVGRYVINSNMNKDNIKNQIINLGKIEIINVLNEKMIVSINDIYLMFTTSQREANVSHFETIGNADFWFLLGYL